VDHEFDDEEFDEAILEEEEEAEPENSHTPLAI
jgi:hypothetical protein